MNHPAIVPGNGFSTFLVEAGVKFLGQFSWKSLHRLALFIGWLVFQLGIRRKVTVANLRAAFPAKTPQEINRLAIDAYANMTLIVLEALTFHLVPQAQQEERVKFENWQVLEDALREGKGVLLATGHFGNWETVGVVMARRGIPLSVVVRRLKGAVNARLVENRLASGAELLLPKGAVNSVLGELRRNRVVMQLIDQAIPAEHAVFVPFFGQPTSATPGLSIAAAKSGAPVLLMLVRRQEQTLYVRFEGPMLVESSGDIRRDVQQHVAALTSGLERHIAQHPGQWLWLHRRWKVAPPS